MRGIAFYFFLAAAVCVTFGMGWGIQMSITQDHSLAGAHAHLNLVGWVTLGFFGLYYHVTPTASETALAKLHLAVALLGVILMVPGIVMAIQESGETLAAVGSMVTAASMLIFLYTVLRYGLGRPA